jgi:trigger factor
MLKFPSEYHAENLAGKPVEFKTTVKEIHKSVPAELNDELAKKYGFETLDLLKEDMKKSISANYENAYKARQKDTVFNQIKEHLNFEVPDSVLERITVDGQAADSSIKDARLSVFLMQYAKEKSISVTQEDFSMYVESIARMYGQSAKSLLGFYEKNEQMRESTMNSIFENKIFEALYDAVPVAAKSVSKAEIEEILKPEPHVHTEDCDHSAQ